MLRRTTAIPWLRRACVFAAFTTMSCGARTGPSLGESGPSQSILGQGDAGTTPGNAPASLTLLEGPFSIFPKGTTFSGLKVISRSGGIDVLANHEGPSFAVMARRAAVSETTPSVSWAGAAVDLLPGVVGGTVAAADGDTLEVCHHQFNGDPTSYSTFTGAYQQATGPAMLFGGSSCQGLAFRDGKGLLALHKLPPSGCCSRVELFDVDGHGTLLSKGPDLALPEGELGDVRLSVYPGGFAWAGLVGGAPPAMHVRFRGSGGTMPHSLAVEAPADTPDIAGWPFDAAAALSFPRGTGMRLVVVHESGQILADDAIVAAGGNHIQRAPLGTSPHGLVMAYTECAKDFTAKPGTLAVELHRPSVVPLRALVTITCPAYAPSLAIVGNVVFVVFWSGDEVRGVVLKIVT